MRVSSKSPPRIRDQDDGFAERNSSKGFSPMKGTFTKSFDIEWIYYREETEKNELVSRPVAIWGW